MRKNQWKFEVGLIGTDVETNKPVEIRMILVSYHWIPQPKVR